MPLYFGNGVQCNDKQTLRTTQKNERQYHCTFCYCLAYWWKTNIRPHKTPNPIFCPERWRQRQKYEDRKRNTKTERKIRRRRKKYEDRAKNTNTEEKNIIWTLREKYEDWEKNKKTETEIRKLRKNTKTNREIRRQREKSEYVCFPLSWITTHTTHALDINELKCRCNMTAKCALFECRQMLAPRLGVAHFAYTTILHLIIAKRSQWHQQFL